MEIGNGVRGLNPERNNPTKGRTVLFPPEGVDRKLFTFRRSLITNLRGCTQFLMDIDGDSSSIPKVDLTSILLTPRAACC